MSRPVNAPMISKLLKAGGVPKAGRYTAWGYVGPDGRSQDGFIVMAPRVYAYEAGERKVGVAFTTRYAVAEAQFTQAVAILEAEGYVIETRGRNGVGGTWDFNVIDRRDA